MSIETYKTGTMYEIFMCRAFQTSDNSKAGIHLSNMQNLINAENGDNCVKHLPSADKQLVKVKQYIDKAFDKLIKQYKNSELINSLKQLQLRSREAESSSDLIDVIDSAMKLTKA